MIFFWCSSKAIKFRPKTSETRPKNVRKHKKTPEKHPSTSEKKAKTPRNRWKLRNNVRKRLKTSEISETLMLQKAGNIYFLLWPNELFWGIENRIHMLSFYFVFKINSKNYFFSKNNKTFLLQSILCILLIAYIFLWSMPVVCCYKVNIFYPGLFHEIVNLLVRFYIFIDRHIIDLLDIAPKFYKYIQIKP